MLQLLENAPDWLAKQLTECRENPRRWLNPTSSAIAAELYGSAGRWQEVRPQLEAYLNGAA